MQPTGRNMNKEFRIMLEFLVILSFLIFIYAPLDSRRIRKQ